MDATLNDKQPPLRLSGSSQLGKYLLSYKKTSHFDNDLVEMFF